MDKAGPSGDYDGSNTSIRESKTSTLIIEEVYDANESCLNRLNNIRRGLNLPEFKEYRECLPNAFIDPRRNKYCTISITDRSGEQTSPNSTFRHATVSNNFRSTTSFNLIQDFQQNSPCSRPDTATTENSSISNQDHFFISACNTDFINPNHNFNQSRASFDPFTAAELYLDLTDSRPASTSVSTSPAGVSPLLKKTHLSCDDAHIEYELSSSELRKVGPVNNWSAAVGRTHPDGAGNQLSARCIEIPPKRMRLRLNTPRFSITQGSPSAAVQNCYTKTCADQEKIIQDCEVIELQTLPSRQAAVQNFEFRGCLSAVDRRCETLAIPEPRSCMSNQFTSDSPPITFKNIPHEESTEYLKTPSEESFTQDIQACINLEEDSKQSPSNTSCTQFCKIPSQQEVAAKESKLMIANKSSDISATSRSTTSYELSNAANQDLFLLSSRLESNSNNSAADCCRHPSATTVNSYLEDFNADTSLNCDNCQFDKLVLLNDHYSISRPTTASHTCSCDNVNLKINIPSSVEDEEFVDASCLEPNITILESDTRKHNQNKFRFWRFKRGKDRLGSGDTSANSVNSKSDYFSRSSLSYIVSPVKMESNLKLNMITDCEKPNKKSRKKCLLDLDQRNKSKDSVDFEEKELSLINYSDFCMPIKSLEKLPDEKSVKDILQSMSQSIFRKSAEPDDDVDSIGDSNDLKEDLILSRFSNYSNFKTRAELLAEHMKESEKEKEPDTELSMVIKEATYPMPPSSSDENSDGSYYLNRRKPQNTQIRFYEIPSPMNSNTNLNQGDDHSTEECKHGLREPVDTAVKIHDDDDDIKTGFCSNCFCKHLLFPKLSRSYFL